MADKMIRIAGRNPSGNAKAIQTDANGNLSLAALPDLAGTYNIGTVKVDYTAENTATKAYFYLTSGRDLESTGQLLTQIPNFATPATNLLYRRWKIWVSCNANQASKLLIYPYCNLSLGYADGKSFIDSSSASVRVTLYETETSGFPASTARTLFTSLGGGLNACNVVTLPELDGFYENMAVGLWFDAAPTSGSIRVTFEAQK